MDVKKLGIKVEQVGILPAVRNLNKLTESAVKADPAIRTLTNTLDFLKATPLRGLADNLRDVSTGVNSIKLNSKGIAELAKGFLGVSTSITNIASASERLSAQTGGLAQVVVQLSAIKNELKEMQGLAGSISSIKLGNTSEGQKVATVRVTGNSKTYSDDERAAKNLSAAQSRLIAQLEREEMQAGRTRSEYLELRAAKLGMADAAAPYIAKLREAETVTNKAGMSARHYASAMRMVPAQFTDIVTQLAGGQNPFLIMIQQGGQLRDMFGGFKNMALSVGPMVLKFLVNPFTLAAAALGALTYAYTSGSSELEKFNQTLAVTGGVIGLSSSQFASMARSIDRVAGTQSSASEALTAIAATGKIAGTNIEGIATAAIRMEEATGKAIKDTVAEFATLSTTPAESIVKLNDKYHFLTGSIYAQIRALEEQGRVQEAVALAQKTFKDAVESMATGVNENLGTIESGWKKIKKAIGEAKDSVLDFGRQETNAEKLADVSKKIVDAESKLSRLRQMSFGGVGSAIKREEGSLASLLLQKDTLQEALKLEGRVASQKATSLQLQQASVEAEKRYGTVVEANLSKQEKKAKALAQMERDISAARDSGNPWSEDKINKYRSAINAQYEDKGVARKVEKERKQNLQYESEVSSINSIIEAQTQRTEAIVKYGVAADKVSQLEIQANTWAAKAKSQYATEEEKAHAKQMANKYDEAAATEKYNKRLLETKQTQQETITLANEHALSIQKISEGYAQEALYVELTTKEKEKAKALWDIEIEKQTAILKLKKEQAAVQDNPAAYSEYETQIEDTKAFYDQKYALAQRSIGMVQQETSMTNNAKVAFRQYSEDMGSSNEIMKSSFTSMFGSVESAITSFVVNGKFSFKDFAKSMAQSVATMLIKLALLKAAMAAVNMLSSGSASVTTVSADASTGLNSLPSAITYNANGNTFTGTGISKFANGGAFTNSVVNRATPFMFADGGSFSPGVMGEAGPEAVMPLTRGANGKLGVQASGSSGGNQISIVINVDENGSSETTSGSSEKDSKAMAQALAAKMKQVIAEEMRPGGLLAHRR